jgi:putative transposase
MYFNEKYKRVGSLFQGRFKAIEVDSEPYLLQLSRYIHLNPVDLIEPNWKENGLADPKKVNEFLENYRWSSYMDYIGKKNFPSLTSREFLLELFNNSPSEYKKFVKDWEMSIDDLEEMNHLILEK